MTLDVGEIASCYFLTSLAVVQVLGLVKCCTIVGFIVVVIIVGLFMIMRRLAVWSTLAHTIPVGLMLLRNLLMVSMMADCLNFPKLDIA